MSVQFGNTNLAVVTRPLNLDLIDLGRKIIEHSKKNEVHIVDINGFN